MLSKRAAYIGRTISPSLGQDLRLSASERTLEDVKQGRDPSRPLIDSPASIPSAYYVFRTGPKNVGLFASLFRFRSALSRLRSSHGPLDPFACLRVPSKSRANIRIMILEDSL